LTTIFPAEVHKDEVDYFPKNLNFINSASQTASPQLQALALNYQSPEAPFRNNKERRKICRKYLSSE